MTRLPPQHLGELTQPKEEDHSIRCKAKYGGIRCQLRSGHQGSHEHSGAAGSLAWGKPERKRRR